MTIATSDQPLAGEIVLHCEHARALELDTDRSFYKGSYFFQAPIVFRTPAGTMGQATWFVLCEDCYRGSGGEAANLRFNGHYVWQGDADPILVEGHLDQSPS